LATGETFIGSGTKRVVRQRIREELNIKNLAQKIAMVDWEKLQISGAVVAVFATTPNGIVVANTATTAPGYKTTFCSLCSMRSFVVNFFVFLRY